MIPLFHDLRGATVLVFGGGPVGARKARRFAREARVVWVSPRFEGDGGGAERVRAAPDPGDVEGWIDRADPALVVAATDDPDLNGAVGRAAREAGALVNRADLRGERDPGSVVVPAAVRDGSVTVAVATGGRSPALSAHLRDRIAAGIEGAGRMADLAEGIHADLRDRGIGPERRRGAMRALVSSDRVWRAIREGADADEAARAVVEDALDG